MVLVLDHDENGALGVVINRPTEVDVSAVLPAWQPLASLPGVLFQGGPVALDSALWRRALPGDDEEPVGFRRIVGRLGLVDLDTPPEIVAGGSPACGSSRATQAGQAASSRTNRAGAWYVVPDAEARDAFSTGRTGSGGGTAPAARRPGDRLDLPRRPEAELSAR